jgi:hypothetical protein
MDILKKTSLYQELQDNIHLTHYEAVCSIDPDQARLAMEQTKM